MPESSCQEGLAAETFENANVLDDYQPEASCLAMEVNPVVVDCPLEIPGCGSPDSPISILLA